jgi:phosphate transport system permease protein
MSAVARHVFQSQPNAARRRERLTFWLFRCATYLVLVCGIGVFATIVFKGAGTVLTTKAPFINTTFLTDAPESLYVFEFEGKTVLQKIIFPRVRHSHLLLQDGEDARG